MGVNKFADMTDEEFQSMLGLKEHGDTEQVKTDAVDFFNVEENDEYGGEE